MCLGSIPGVPILKRLETDDVGYAVVMCEFCSKIEKLEKIKTGVFRGGYYPKENKTQIVEHKNTFHLFVGCDDSFMSGIEIENIKYCPICGRKLVK